jgi:hypothetical protein
LSKCNFVFHWRQSFVSCSRNCSLSVNI